MRIGELLKDVPKAKNQYAMVNGVHSTKSKTIEKAGLNVKQAQRFETLASYPESVQKAKAKAMENGIKAYFPHTSNTCSQF